MRRANFTESIDVPSSGGGVYLRLKNKGDRIKFRLADTPVYETVHWINGEKVACLRFGEGESDSCPHCEAYEEIVQNEGKEAAYKSGLAPIANFEYPILNRDSGKAAVFQFSAKSIHFQISNYAKEGLDVFAYDWVVVRTEKSPSDYYDVLRMDKGLLSEEEGAELERAKTLVSEEGKKQSTSVKSSNDDVPIEAYDF